MRLTIIGTGYVGLVAGAGFADFGNEVVCVDIDAERIAGLKRGEMPIYEPTLQEIVRTNVDRRRLTFSTDTAASVAGAQIVFIAVGTPSDEDGSADLNYVLAAARDVARGLTGPCSVVMKSTVPIGTGDKLEELFATSTSHRVSVVSNPEFLKEGDAVNDFMKPARIIIGCNDEHAVESLKQLYAPFTRTNNRLLFVDRRSAEMIKYAANAMLATRISFMNELSHLASAVGADIESVRRGLGSDPRIGNKFLFAGAGYGGSCFPKDIRALLKTGEDHDLPLDLVNAVQRVNQKQQKVLGKMVQDHYGTTLVGRRIALWGLSFKPKTDDVRESPAIEAASALVAAGATVCAYDPAAIDTARRILGDKISYASDMYEATAGADALVLATEWPSFRRPDFARVAECMKHKVLIDGRNIWEPGDVREQGFLYLGIGRP